MKSATSARFPLVNPNTVRLAVAVGASAAGRGIAALSPLIVIPMLFEHLGADRYGAWATLTSLTAMAMFADLGVPNSLLTRLANASGRTDTATARQLIATAYCLLSAAALVLGVLAITFTAFVEWNTLFRLQTPPLARDVQLMAVVCFAAFFIGIPLAIVQRVQYAFNHAGEASLWQALGALSAIGACYLSVRSGAPVIISVASVVAPPLLALVANSVLFYLHRRPDLTPRLPEASATSAVDLLRLGAQFLGLSLFTAAALNLDAPLIASTLGVSAVAEFSVVAKLCAVLNLLIALVYLPLWSANGQAIARGDIAWVRKTRVRLSIGSALLVGLLSAGLIAFQHDLLLAWMGRPINISPTVVFGLSAFSVLAAYLSPMFMVLNSTGTLVGQYVGWALFLIGSVPAKYFGARHFGIEGVALAGAFVYLATLIPVTIYAYLRCMRKLEARTR